MPRIPKIQLTILLLLGIFVVQCHKSPSGGPSGLNIGPEAVHSRLQKSFTSQNPILLSKVQSKRKILAPLRASAHSHSKKIVTKASLEKSVAMTITSSPPHSRDFWNDAVAMSLSQITLDEPTTAKQIVDKVLTQSSQSKLDDGSLPKNNVLLSQLAKTAHAEELNIFENTHEATYIAAETALEETPKIDLGALSPSLEGFSLEITPKDLLKSYLLKCDQKLCQASILKPVVLKRSIPIGLLANIDIVFAQANDTKDAQLSYDLSIDGTIKAFHLGPVLALSVTLGANFRYVPSKHSLFLDNPRCSLDLSCNIAIAKLGASLSKSGLTFDASADLGDLGNRLLKMTPNNGHLSKHISMDDIQDCIEDALEKLPASKGDEDIYWEELLSKFKPNNQSQSKEVN